MSEIVKMLERTILYTGHGEASDLPEQAASHITALEARVRELEGRLKEITTDLPYVMGWNDGFDHALTETIGLSFPTMLRKMWSGGEVENWLNERKAEARAALNQEKQTP